MTFTLWKYRRFIWTNALADLRHRFSGSVAGYLWNVLIPLAQIAVFAVVFSVMMGYRVAESPNGPKGAFAFVIFLCSGLLPWNAFAETLMRGSGALVGSAGYLRKLAIPEQIFVAKEACSGFLSTLLTLVIFSIFSVFCARWGPWPQWIQCVPMLVLFLSFAYGLGLILSCLNVFFRDIQPLMGVVMLLWMWLTPVVYLETIFADPRHAWVLKAMQFNPAYPFVRGFQQSLFESTWVSGPRWATCIGFAVAANVVAMLVLRRLRGEIRDVL